MCGISASFDIVILDELMTLNNKRGRHSFSLMVYDVEDECIFALYQGFNDCRSTILKYYDDISKSTGKSFYYISHSQAPTSTDTGCIKEFDRIHPAKLASHYLYHNGIIKPSSIGFLKEKTSQWLVEWDTELLLHGLLYYPNYSTILNHISGSYACMLIEGGYIRTFRNDSSILYYDRQLNFSSINYKDEMIELPTGVIFELDLCNKTLLIDENNIFSSPDHGFAFV